MHFSTPVGEDVERRQDSGMSPDYSWVLVGALWKTRLIGRFPEIGKPWNRAEKRPHAINIGGVHDDGSHGSKCLMGLRPGVAV